ncbi:hypothetical protein [Marinobacter nauticus]|uniref:hypothetical protein n=1 Tax=Marinobacter nauticus TaxID=2743 RepID=UPI001CFEB2DE|nr:hypothetical protein [Marinobacter nauticus]
MTSGQVETNCKEAKPYSDTVEPYKYYVGYYTSHSCGTGCSNNHFFKAFTPACEAPNFEDPETGECLTPQEPSECREIGEFYNPQNQQCVPSCPSGSSLDHYCNTLPEPECNESSGDFQGTIGWGDDHRNVCSGETSCPQNHRYAYQETAEGTWKGACINNDANPPICPGGFESVLMISGDNFACGELNEDKENDPNDTSNGDSDGDGQADDNGIAGQLEDIKGLLGKGNNTTNNINETLNGLGKKIQDGTKSITDAIGNIPGGGGGGGTGDGGDGEQETPINWSGDPIDLKIGDGLDELNAIQGEYENLIANIRSEMAASFGSFTGGGGLEDNNVTVYGETFNAGLSKFGAHLSIVGSIILFAAAFIGLGIVMGAKD